MGDSGIFSRRGVEFPLVGGPPHGFRGRLVTPSCAWISRALNTNDRPLATFPATALSHYNTIKTPGRSSAVEYAPLAGQETSAARSS